MLKRYLTDMERMEYDFETKRNETKRNETKRNETKRNETKRNETKRFNCVHFCYPKIYWYVKKIYG